MAGNFFLAWRGTGEFDSSLPSGTSSDDAYATSPDGVTWTWRTLPTDTTTLVPGVEWRRRLTSVYKYQDKIFATWDSEVHTGFAASSDGISWTFTAFDAGGFWRDVIFCNGRLIAVSDNLAHNGAYSGHTVAGGTTPGSALGSAYSTDNGLTWNSGAVGPIGARLATNGTRVVASSAAFELGVSDTTYVSVNTGVKHSTDGATWTAATMPAGFTSSYVPILFWDGFEFVAVNTAGSVARSSDGITWALQYTNLGEGSAKAIASYASVHFGEWSQSAYLVASGESFRYSRDLGGSAWQRFFGATAFPNTSGTLTSNGVASSPTRWVHTTSFPSGTPPQGNLRSTSSLGTLGGGGSLLDGPTQARWIGPLEAPPTVTLPLLTLDAGEWAKGQGALSLPALYAVPAPVVPTFWTAKVGAREA